MCIKQPKSMVKDKLDNAHKPPTPISPYLDIPYHKSDNKENINVYKTVCTQCNTVLSPSISNTGALSIRLSLEEEEQFILENLQDESCSRSPMKLSHGLCKACFTNMDADLDLKPLNIGPSARRRIVLSKSMSSPRQTRPLPPPPSPPRVLIVDDNKLQRQIHRRMVEQEGFECEVAASGMEAIEMIKKSKFTHIMMDLVMSPMDGWTAARRIRGSSTASSPAILAVTGLKIDEKLRAQCSRAGIDDVVQKPVSPNMLSKLLDKISKVDTADQ